jgi:hypothetical protein
MNKVAKHTLLLAGICVSVSCAAHDFWVQPKGFWVGPGAVTPPYTASGTWPLSAALTDFGGSHHALRRDSTLRCAP